jgi:DNA (cytosine-5)-methyltransferase 1
MGGKHRAFNDARDMFPAAVEVVRRVKPKAFIIENVKGLTRASFHNYYQYILLQFEFPELKRRVDESWSEHYQRLQQEKSSDRRRSRVGLTYNVLPKLLNAANHGVPQRRERFSSSDSRSDLSVKWDIRGTHSLDGGYSIVGYR